MCERERERERETVEEEEEEEEEEEKKKKKEEEEEDVEILIQLWLTQGIYPHPWYCIYIVLLGTPLCNEPKSIDHPTLTRGMPENNILFERCVCE